jgi:hypothetical protein
MKRTTFLALGVFVPLLAACSSGAVTTRAPASSAASAGTPSGSPSSAPSPAPTPTPQIGASAIPSTAARCPTEPTLADLIALDRDPGPLTVAYRPIYGTYSEAATECYGSGELRFVAFVAAPDGLGGTRSYRIEPDWLVSRSHWIAPDDSKQPEGFFSGPFLPVAVPAAGETSFADLAGHWVEVRGHFADPAADTCRVTFGDGASMAPIHSESVEICRTSFVVTAIDGVPAPSPSS